MDDAVPPQQTVGPGFDDWLWRRDKKNQKKNKKQDKRKIKKKTADVVAAGPEPTSQ